MRSEKEIKQKDFSDFTEFNGVTIGGRKQYEHNSNKTKRWLLKGKPRYSLKEAQIIFKKMNEGNRIVKEFEVMDDGKILLTNIEKKESCYSVAELEKISLVFIEDYEKKKLVDWRDKILLSAFFKYFEEYPKSVEAILNGI